MHKAHCSIAVASHNASTGQAKVRRAEASGEEIYGLVSLSTLSVLL